MFRTPKLLAFAGILVMLSVSIAVLVSCNANRNDPPKYSDNYSSKFTDTSTVNAPGNYTAGTVSAVNGNTVTITNNLTASPVTVTVGPNTIVTKGVWASVSDLSVGITMAVSGSKDSMGMINATYINVAGPIPDSGNDTRGTLIQIDGNTLILTESQNQPVTVNVPPGTPIYLTLRGKLADITAGSQVNVRPKADTNNRIAATWIVIKPPSNRP